MPTDDLTKISVVGMPWYRKGDYARLRASFADGARLHETYSGWSAAARATEANLVAQGHRVVRVEIEPGEFAAWCSALNVAPDAQARMRYANEFAYLDKRFGDAKDEVYRRAQHTTTVVERHVTPVFTYRPDGRFDFEGSGLLAGLDARYYLVTAAHVLDACEQGCVVQAAEATGQQLSGTRIVTGRPAGTTRDDDVFDIGFVRLSGSEVAGVGADNFLDLTYTVDGPPAEPVEAMIALGFAARDQSVDQSVDGGMVRTKLTMFMTGPESAHAYRLARTDSRSHLLVRYQRNGIIFNGQHQGSAPSLKGMSGGGLWQVSLDGEVQLQSPALAAMIIEQPQSYGTAILATRAPLIRSFIRRFDTLVQAFIGPSVSAMKVPNADRAIIAADKLTGYLLNVSHKRGGPKARLLLNFGYSSDNPHSLESDLRAQHLSLDVTRTHANAYGVVYEIEGPIKTPGGRSVRFCSVWQVDTGTDVPRFITMYPRQVMLFEMYGDVILTRDVTEHGLRAGDVGTVVERHSAPGVPEEGYSVEFFDMTGNTVAVATLPASALRLPTPADRPAVRALSA